MALLWGAVGCERTGTTSRPDSSELADDNTPTFSLAWSEYPSWSVFGVADELGLIDGDSGMMGPIEQEHRVDIVLREASYDSCLNMFGSGDCDAVCMTNMDALIISPTRDGVAVLPTSTSNGADACLVTPAVKDVEDLKGRKVYGLKGTVSEYCFVRCLEKRGLDEKEFEFTNQDPGAAATSMQQGAETHEAIMVWNPFVLQTLQDRSDVRVLFDSSEIPGEIVDMVVIGRDSLQKPGADRFVKAVMAAFYQVNDELKGERGDEVLVALGEKFSKLGIDEMRRVVEQTEFYQTPEAARDLMDGESFRQVMQTVEKFCIDHGLITEASVAYGTEDQGVKLRFDSSFLETGD
jgi:NitT/TauT family transport system substrate-binding protein